MARSPFYVDGQSYPSPPLRPNYEADQYVDCYRTLTCFRKDINVKRNDYVKGYCLYALEIDPYYSFNIKRQGHCRLEMKFAKPLEPAQKTRKDRAEKRVRPGNGINRALRRSTPLKTGSRSELRTLPSRKSSI